MSSVHEPCLIIVCGLSFAGKSTLAAAIRARLGCAEVDVDEMKERLYGLNVPDQDLTPDQWAAIYRATDECIRACLAQGQSVIDASRNFSRAEREHSARLAEDSGARLVTVYVDTPEPVARRRWLANLQHPTRRQVSPDGFEQIAAGFEPPTEGPLVYHYDEDSDAWLERNIRRLGA